MPFINTKTTVSLSKSKKDSLTAEMNAPAISTNVPKLQELSLAIESLTIQLEQLYEKWEALSE